MFCTVWGFTADNVAVYHTDVHQEVEQLAATTFATFSCSRMPFSFGLQCYSTHVGIVLLYSFWTDNSSPIVCGARWPAYGVDDWYGLLALPGKTLNSLANDH